MTKLFGTDGIRGKANVYPMTPEMAVRVGSAVARFFEKDTTPHIVIGKDTRISGDMLASALAAGICAAGGTAEMLEVMPTPGVAFMTARSHAAAGIVVSASHNPHADNGIKFFDSNGHKLSDATEAELEKAILRTDPSETSLSDASQDTCEPGRILQGVDAGTPYVRFLAESMRPDFNLQGMKIVLDCSNGATYRLAPALFKKLDADVTALFTDPDGRNINFNCGSQHPETLSKTVIEIGADIGLAFDGDGDRLIAVDETGAVMSGDQIMAVCAAAMQKKGVLKKNLLVSTVMSNMGLGRALQSLGIHHLITRVGDRYVFEKMVETGAVLGGENSGHMIFADHQTTGDGMLTALQLLDAMQSRAKPISELGRIMTVYPQVLINVAVKEKPALDKMPAITAAIKAVELQLGNRGRVLVRYSGTRSICRIMVEGPTPEETDRHCREIANVVAQQIG